MAAKKKSAGDRFTEVRNAKALRDYTVEERFEAGIALRGTEVKSIRLGKAQINDAFGRVHQGEIWLMNAHIDEYAFDTLHTHQTRRSRKLLLRKSQIRKIAEALETGGRSLVPLRLYFKEALVKVELAIGVGKKLYDKREDLKKKAVMREVDRVLKSHR